jgi:hypothetical protein
MSVHPIRRCRKPSGCGSGRSESRKGDNATRPASRTGAKRVPKAMFSTPAAASLANRITSPRDRRVTTPFEHTRRYSDRKDVYLHGPCRQHRAKSSAHFESPLRRSDPALTADRNSATAGINKLVYGPMS